MEVAVSISLISRLEAEIHAYEVYRLPSWIFPLPVWSYMLLSPDGKLERERVGIAVDILLISCLEAKILAFEV